MELELTRKWRHEQALLGELLSDGLWDAFTIENGDKAIPAGRYPVQVTRSKRASEGKLWTPLPDFLLPEIIIPGHAGVRIHAANYAHQLGGPEPGDLSCIAPGQARGVDYVERSRSAMAALAPAIWEASKGAGCWITIAEDFGVPA